MTHEALPSAGLFFGVIILDKRFREKARELECNEDEAAFEEKLKAVAGQKPKLEKDEAPQRPNKGDKEC